MRPEAEEFKEWLQHPVTEWALGLMTVWGEEQKTMWANMAWESGEVDQLALTEARVRSDCYTAIPSMPFEDWTAIEDRLSDTET
jgi:hypothetical protein